MSTFIVDPFVRTGGGGQKEKIFFASSKRANDDGDDDDSPRSLLIKSLVDRRRTDKGAGSEMTIGSILHRPPLNTSSGMPAQMWTNYHFLISERGLVRDEHALTRMIESLSMSEVVLVEEMEKGTQIKLKLTLADGTLAIAKPIRVSRAYQTPPNHFYFSDIERHNAEIAAFHVDKVLGLYRAPPTVGRILNLTRDIIPHSPPSLLSTFFVSPVGNTCFRGQCRYYCDTAHAVCGSRPKELVEFSMQLMLPSDPLITWIRMSHPFRRSYSTKRLAEWEVNGKYCEQKVFTERSFHSRLMLDMIDECIFDFLIRNMDRHHLVKMEELGNDSTILHIDQGRAFGRYDHDEMSIIEPLIQCCLVRHSTAKKLMKFYSERSLASRVRESMLNDPISPILANEHFDAIDRRLVIVLYQIWKCANRIGDIERVIIDDGL